MKIKYTTLFAVIVLALLMAGQNQAQAIFPLRVSSNKRYLVNHQNKPFPILGRTAWSIISQSESGYKQFIANTTDHGCNAIEVSVLIHWPDANHPPFNGRGDRPFLRRLNGADWDGKLSYNRINQEGPDLSTPNEKYWNYVDGFLDYCEAHGILVFLFPAYLGFNGQEQGWMQELLANGVGKTEAYGKWIASRFKYRGNIVWMLLGDYGKLKPAETTIEAALIRGLKSVPGQSLQYSAESFSGQNSADHPDFGKEMTLNGSYTWTNDVPVSYMARKAYRHNPVMPSFLLEEPYDEEGPDGNKYNPNATQPVRRFEWWGWLGNIGGYMAGNGYIWPFKDSVWERHLNTQAALDMSRLNHFIRSVKWWTLVPSGLAGMDTVIVDADNTDTSASYVAAAVSANRDLLIAYLPPGHRGGVTIKLGVLKKRCVARWFDPATGKFINIGHAALNNEGTRLFTPPGNNGAGDADWVLLLEAKEN